MGHNLHIGAIDHLAQAEHRHAIAEAIGKIPASGGLTPNVAKLSLRTGRLSLLAYVDFDEDPFPFAKVCLPRSFPRA